MFNTNRCLFAFTSVGFCSTFNFNEKVASSGAFKYDLLIDQ